MLTHDKISVFVNESNDIHIYMHGNALDVDFGWSEAFENVLYHGRTLLFSSLFIVFVRFHCLSLCGASFTTMNHHMIM